MMYSQTFKLCIYRAECIKGTRSTNLATVGRYGTKHCGITVATEPLELAQHGEGSGAVLVGQVEKVRKQGQVLQGQWFSRVQRVLLRSWDILIRLHGLLLRRLSLRAAAATSRHCPGGWFV